MPKIKRGVYFLADDRVIGLVIAFLNSFRKYNPHLSLCLIPYNANTHRLKQLQETYNFSIFSNQEILNQCDQISGHFHKHIFGLFRKLALWEGEFDEFVYIDVDTVVLANIDFVFEFLSDYDFCTGHSNVPGSFKHVWKNSVYGKLTKDQVEYAANTGFIASKKNALPLKYVTARLDQALAFSPHMTLLTMEQSVLNYFMVTSNKRYSSLNVLAREKNYPPEIMMEAWAGEKGGWVNEGQFFWKNNRQGKVFLVHWAGSWKSEAGERVFFRVLKYLGIKRKEECLTIRYFMPYKSLWNYYRFLR